MPGELQRIAEMPERERVLRLAFDEIRRERDRIADRAALDHHVDELQPGFDEFGLEDQRGLEPDGLFRKQLPFRGGLRIGEIGRHGARDNVVLSVVLSGGGMFAARIRSCESFFWWAGRAAAVFES